MWSKHSPMRRDMTRERIDEIHRCLEAFYATDSGDAAWEKTTLIEELLAEVEALTKKLAETHKGQCQR